MTENKAPPAPTPEEITESLLSQIGQLTEQVQQEADSAALWQERAIHYMNGEAQALLQNKRLTRQLAASQPGDQTHG